MFPLTLNITVAGTSDGIRANIESALARNLPEIIPALVSHDGWLVCVGSGPSMPNFLEEIRAEREQGRPILAVKGAHDYLCRQGIQPDLWICVDPRDRAYLVEEANDHTTYLLSSRCDPSMFEALANRHVIVFHAYAEEEHLPCFEGKFMIGGGSTSGMRGLTVGYVLGFRNFVLYGYDSCLAADQKTKRFTGEGVGEKGLIDVYVDGRQFWCNGAMAQQAKEFQDYYTTLERFHVEVKGDGLIAALVAARKARKFAY
jgi:hypothetical protein